ncbi:DUF2207 domain-containing protein [Shinella zoogloeoides]|uniref:DUF2207 domain-containing protein n=1 Tax=Shinella zoogloeoides TaxID=352475 RepID=A0A6N8TCY0_SHIZO|nr:DUF2207 domain-containing protein [Shinella zoogloeoides]MXO00036.1 DUF2207 domain-containing protein [Shinella zoogloeoides]UEX82375.1 DUF2207 domain-containing protein [Shinella zoogloeoides]
MPRIAALLTLWLCLLVGSAARAEEYFDRYHSDIALSKNGAMTVTETIRVHAEGNAIRRGIYRDFPLTFADAEGREKEVGFRIVGVARDGRPEPYRTETIRRGVRIYFGSSDVMLAPGFHEYRLTYETTRQIRFFDSHDELFWNVTGTQWAFPIRQASATVRLPPGVRAEALTYFTGPMGATERNARAENRGDTATFETTRGLGPHEGLTIGVKMPAGSIARPTAAEERAYFLKDNRNLFLAFGGLALVLGYYVWAWLAVGRDPPGGVVVPRWDAPEGISPALVNYIDEKGFGGQGWTAVSAAFLNLAVKGLVELSDLATSITVTRTGKPAEGALPTGEATLLAAVPTAGSHFTIEKSNGKRVQRLGAEFRGAMEREHRRKYYLANWPQVISGILLSLACLAALAIFGSLPEEGLVLVILPVFASVFVSIFALALGRNFRQAKTLGARIMAVVIMAFVGSVFVTVFGGIATAIVTEGAATGHLPLFAAVGGIVVTNLVFFFLMGAPTPLGRRMMDGIAGLRQYLTLAEQDRMNMAGAPEMSPRHFETLLPYAVALGVEKPWSETFDRWLLTAAAAGAAAAYQPGWYRGDSFASSRFADRVGGFAGSMARSMTASLPDPPKSSSSGFSSGGGSSGGGGGGGGGGGW